MVTSSWPPRWRYWITNQQDNKIKRGFKKMNMFLKNGNMETVFTLNQFENIIAENLGHEAINVMEQLVGNGDKRVEAIKEDLDIAYDSIKSLEAALNEANNLISDLLYMYLGNVKRIDRKKIEKDLEEIYKATELNRIDY